MSSWRWALSNTCPSILSISWTRRSIGTCKWANIVSTLSQNVNRTSLETASTVKFKRSDYDIICQYSRYRYNLSQAGPECCVFMIEDSYYITLGVSEPSQNFGKLDTVKGLLHEEVNFDVCMEHIYGKGLLTAKAKNCVKVAYMYYKVSSTCMWSSLAHPIDPVSCIVHMSILKLWQYNNIRVDWLYICRYLRKVGAQIQVENNNNLPKTETKCWLQLSIEVKHIPHVIFHVASSITLQTGAWTACC